MGSSSWTADAFTNYSLTSGKAYNYTTGRVSNQVYEMRHMANILNPKGVIRECCISEEHPNPIPVILALDVTGSMGSACQETAEALGIIMKDLYSKFKDIEIMVMGIGDFECDDAPLQAGQFESDIRIAEQLDKIYMEHGGGGNSYESYKAAWYFGLHNTKLEPFDKQGRKGIIITMGDEPLNPSLPEGRFKEYLGAKQLSSLKTPQLYEEASKKFDIFHIAVDDPADSYERYKKDIQESFGKVLGGRLKTSSINALSNTIVECIEESINLTSSEASETKFDENGAITW